MLTALFACREETRVNMVSGTLYQDCENRLSNTEVALKANIGVDFGDPIILGTAVTNASGQFSFAYELEEDDEGTGDLLLIKTNSFETIISDIKLNIDQQLELYRNNQTSIKVNLAGNLVFSATDTLFYGINKKAVEEFKVQPSNGVIDTIIISVPNLEQGKTFDAVFYFGLGSADFQLAKEALSIQDSSYQHIPLMLKPCAKSESVEMVLN